MRTILVGLALLLIGCGGSSEPENTFTPPPAAPVSNLLEPSRTENGLELYAPESVTVGQSIGLSVRSADNDPIRHARWRQIGGPNVSILAPHTQTIGFDVEQAGDYLFTTEATTLSGQTRELTYQFSVLESNIPQVNIRLDHNVNEFGKVSLRLDTSEGISVSRIEWRQQTGPTASKWRTQEGNDRMLFFDAPAVDQDQIIRVIAEVTDERGNRYTDDALVSVHDADIDWQGYFPDPDVFGRVVTEDMLPASPDSPYSSVLVDCLYSNRLANSCPFSRLPIMGENGIAPSVDDVLAHTIVSHPWMANRFRQFLEQSVAGPDILQLLGAATGVVISYEVRPAIYWSATGAVYLDAVYLWGTPEERDTLNDLPDPRSGFGAELQFGIFWRYVKNNDYYFGGNRFPASERLIRDFTDIEASLSFLLYHELAHANDFIPPSRWSSLSDNDSPLSFTQSTSTLSDSFSERFPLNSDELKSLATVSFFGQQATDEQKGYRAEDATLFFEPDFAPAYYSYATIYEDYATLFERFMMAYRMQAYADVGIISLVDNPEAIVTWGQRGRINDPRLQPRVRDVVSQMLPGLPVDEIQRQLGAPRQLDPTRSWRGNLNLDASDSSAVTMDKNELDSIKNERLAFPDKLKIMH